MPSGLILLTGATGHVGFATLILALKKGYTIRAAVRSEAKASTIREHSATKPYLGQLFFVTVPDITVSGAFDEAIKDVDYVVHIASPLSSTPGDPEVTIIAPAINGTLSILHSALTAPSIKRIVITASVASIIPDDPTTPFTPNTVLPDPPKPNPSQFHAYVASKRLAYNRTLDFISQSHPSYSIINIMPSFIIGPNLLATTPQEVGSGSNRVAIATILGQNMGGMLGNTCHIDDVALAHVASLSDTITIDKGKGYRNFGVDVYYPPPHKLNWGSATEIVKKHFPKEVEEGVFPLGGKGEDFTLPFDARETERVLFEGRKARGWEEQVVDLAGYYAEVYRKSAAKA